MKKKYVFLFILFLFILSPFLAYGTPVLYSVGGDWDGRDVFGTMVIEDTVHNLVCYPGYVFEVCGQFGDHIENFTFGNGRDLFYGHDGGIWCPFCFGSICVNFEPTIYGKGHFQGREITFLTWWSATFYNEDGSFFAVQEGFPLPPRMIISDLVYGFPEFDPYFEITLELERVTPQSQPVPEPATMLLLSAGLIGLAGLRKKFRER